MRLPARIFPVVDWSQGYGRADMRGDLAAGLTVGAMLVPQAMAYALLAGLPPQVGLYAATVPLIAYAVFGTSRQLAVGPVAIVSLLTASALAPLVEQESADYLSAAALLALMVGAVHLVLGAGRLGFLVNFVSHAVLVGFTAAAAIIIGFSQAKHLFGVSVPRRERFHQSVAEVVSRLEDTHTTTLAVGVSSLAALFVLKRLLPGVPAALVVVGASVLAVEAFGLTERGVQVVGDIPQALPKFAMPNLDGSLVSQLASTALVITLVGFMESIAVAKTYARRHRYDVDPNAELVGLGAANVAAGLFGGYPVTGGFSRTAVNDTAGARTPLASLLTAAIVLITIAFFTPVLASVPNAALAAIIIMAVVGLIDVREVGRIAQVRRSDLIGLGVAFAATLSLGIELGIVVAVVSSMLVVFARMSTPHSAILGHVRGTTSYRNVDRFPETQSIDGITIVRIDAALSFVNAVKIKKLIIGHAENLATANRMYTANSGDPKGALVLDASGINDIDTAGFDMLSEVMAELDDRQVALHLAEVRGPVRDILHRAEIWHSLRGRIHASTHDAVAAIQAGRPAPEDPRRHGIDERPFSPKLERTMT